MHLMLSLRRSLSTATNPREAYLYISSIFPLQLATWDPRYYVGLFREETLLSSLRSKLESAGAHGFTILDMKPYRKDGGVFVQFSYNNVDDEATALSRIETALKSTVDAHGGLTSWNGLNSGSLWVVRGKPWLEDMHLYPSRLLKVSFEGPDVSEELIYENFRPYGHIRSLQPPGPVPSGTLRSAVISYKSIRSAAIARNTMHGTLISGTRLRTTYEQPLQTNAVRSWLSSHPKIVLPVLAFLLGTLTYTIFDPIRSTMVQAKVEDWFDVEKFRLYKWLRANTYDRLAFGEHVSNRNEFEALVWKQWEDAEAAIRSYLMDTPSTVSFIHGPQGSGKMKMLNVVLKDLNREVLVIDCTQIQKASSDAQLISSLAKQCGYWPVFSFLNSFNHFIDLASVGLIGQKSGLSSSLTEQVQQILDVVGHALANVTSSHRAMFDKRAREREQREAQEQEDAYLNFKIRRGLYHDGRLDCIAGNGVMSELGVGDEAMAEWEADAEGNPEHQVHHPIETRLDEKLSPSKPETRPKNAEGSHDVESLPIVVLKNYASIGTGKDDVLDILSQWVASLVERQVAHVVVMSDNRENAKRLAKAIPAKPLYSVALHDADAESALAFVQQKLRDTGISLEYNARQVHCVNQLGGRTSDLESLIHKIRGGMEVEDAFEDIISRGVSELRKRAFGDDVEDAKSLPWSREQAWVILKGLSKGSELSYYHVLAEFPFKGDENALRSMEKLELITIGTINGRPAIIKPGRPVYKFVFERLAEDPIFHANNEISYNNKVISSAQATIKDCEQELLTLKDISTTSDSKWPFGTQVSAQRSRYLAEKMHQAQRKIEDLEKKNEVLKKALAKGG